MFGSHYSKAVVISFFIPLFFLSFSSFLPPTVHREPQSGEQAFNSRGGLTGMSPVPLGPLPIPLRQWLLTLAETRNYLPSCLKDYHKHNILLEIFLSLGLRQGQGGYIFQIFHQKYQSLPFSFTTDSSNVLNCSETQGVWARR